MESVGVKRDVALDVAKGLAITLVVSFHVLVSNGGDWSVISHKWYVLAPFLFNMPLFIFISGYLVHSMNFGVIKHRSMQLVLPYIVWSIIFYFCSGFFDTGFIVRSNLIKTLLYDVWTMNSSSLWFLPLILACYLITYLTRGKPWAMLIAILAAYGLSQIPWPNSIFNIHIPETEWFSIIAWYLPFFAAGYFISKYREKLHSMSFFKWFCLAAFPVLFLLGEKLKYNAFSYNWPDIFASGGDVIAVFYRFTMGLLGIGLAFALAALFARVAAIRRPFQYLGGITLGIYCSHCLFRTIGVGSGIIRVLLTTIVALSLSTALIWLLQRSRITNFLFLGAWQKLFSRKIVAQEKKGILTGPELTTPQSRYAASVSRSAENSEETK